MGADDYRAAAVVPVSEGLLSTMNARDVAAALSYGLEALAEVHAQEVGYRVDWATLKVETDVVRMPSGESRPVRFRLSADRLRL